MNRLPTPFTWLLQRLGRFAHTAFGDISWRPPEWVGAVKAGAIRRPGLSIVSFLGFIALIVAGTWGWHWYSNLPKPQMVDWSIAVSPLPEPNTEFQPQNLTLTFDRSVAKLESIGKDVTAQVNLSPKVKGKWTWSGGTQLIFTPTESWSAATTYKIKLAKGLFTKHTRIETFSKEFRTAPFTVEITDTAFYVNPKDPKVKQITATLTFSYPVDHASLEKNLTLAMENGENVFANAPNDTGRCAITYDKQDRIAYVRSVNVAVPAESSHAILTVPESVTTTAGKAGLNEKEDSQVLVSSLADLFRFSSAKSVIVTNKQGDPDQALILTTSVGVKPEILAKAIHVWILPKQKPGTDDETYAWQSPSEVNADVLAKSKTTPFKLVPSEEEYATMHSFKLKVPENAYIFVEVDKGLEALGGFQLSDKYASVCQVPAYPRDVHIMHEGSLLALSGERKLSISSRGVEQLEYRLERITPSSINHLVSQSEGSFQSPVFTNYNFDESNIAEQIIRRQNISDTDTSRSDYSALDFSEFVKNSDENHGKLGLFILRVLGRQEGEDGGFYKQDGTVLPVPDKSASNGDDSDTVKDPGERSDIMADRRLILVTDLGLLIKDNADDTHDVFVQSIKTGKPVGGAHVDVLGKNGIPVVSVETDDTGRASIPSLDDFTREKKPVAYVVRHDEDVSFLPFGREDRELNFSRFDTSGVTGLAPDDLTAFIFTDRGIYRPGDEARLGLIIKQRNWQGKLDGVPLRLDIVDPRGNVVQSRSLKLNATGFLEATFPTRETSPTGKYEVNCYMVKGKDDETLLGSQTLKVAEFLPDRLKIKATLSTNSPEGWVSATGLSGKIVLQNLYGTPSVGHKVTGKNHAESHSIQLR